MATTRRTIATGSVLTEAEYLRVRTLVMGPDRSSEDEALSRAGVPPRFLHAAHPRAVEVGNALLDGMNAYACGPVGTRKTRWPAPRCGRSCATAPAACSCRRGA